MESWWLGKGNILPRGLSVEVLEKGPHTQDKVVVSIKLKNASKSTYTIRKPDYKGTLSNCLYIEDNNHKPLFATNFFPSENLIHSFDELVVIKPAETYQTPWINIAKGRRSFYFKAPGKYKLVSNFFVSRTYDLYYGRVDMWPKHLQNK